MSPLPLPRRYVNKWVSLSASLTALLGSGLSYAFALYAGDLKERFQFSQAQIEGVAACLNLGGYLGLPAGLLYDFLLREGHRRGGPRVVMLLGALISSAGYLSLWRLEGASESSAALKANGGETAAPFALVCASAFVAANGASFLDCSALATAVRNHRGAQRGGAVGALKAAVGLSGSLFATAYLAAFSSSGNGNDDGARRFLLFLAAAPLALAVVSSIFVNVVPFEQDDEAGGVVVLNSPAAASATTVAAAAASSPFSPSSSSFDLLPPSARVATAAGTLLLLALYVTGATLVLRGPEGAPAALTSEARIALTLGLVVVASGPALLPSWGAGLWARRAKASREEETEDGEEDEGDSSCCNSESEEGATEPLLLPPGGREESLLLSPAAPATPPPPPPVLRDPSFWLLFAACASAAAAGLSFINNAAQIAASAGLAPSAAPVLVSAFSVANCVGRLAFGSLSERALHSSGGRVPRPLALAAALVMASAASAALAVARSGELPPVPPSPSPPPPPPTPSPTLPPSSSLLLLFPSPLLPLSSANAPFSASPSSPLLLPAVAACAGAAFGGMWSVMAAATADLFGVRRYASTYALLQFAPALGSFAFARGLAGKLYDRAAAAQQQQQQQGPVPGGSNSCSGLHACFGETFKVCSLLCLAGVFCSVLLALRTRDTYLELGRELRESDDERERVVRAATEAAARAAALEAASRRQQRRLSHHKHLRSHALSERSSIF